MRSRRLSARFPSDRQRGQRQPAIRNAAGDRPGGHPAGVITDKDTMPRPTARWLVSKAACPSFLIARTFATRPLFFPKLYKLRARVEQLSARRNGSSGWPCDARKPSGTTLQLSHSSYVYPHQIRPHGLAKLADSETRPIMLKPIDLVVLVATVGDLLAAPPKRLG